MSVNPYFSGSSRPPNARRALARLALFVALCGSMAPVPAQANPFLAKSGEAPTTVQVATCAVSGGFVHLYTALDNGLFDKYAIKVEHKFISGSAMNLAAPKPREFTSY